MRTVTGIRTLIASLVLVLLGSLGAWGTALGGSTVSEITALRIRADPQDAAVGGQITFTVHACTYPQDQDPDFGTDGEPGGDADDCRIAKNARASAQGGVGTLRKVGPGVFEFTISKRGTLVLNASIPRSSIRMTRTVGAGRTGGGPGGPPTTGGVPTSVLVVSATIDGIPAGQTVEVPQGQSVVLTAWICPTDDNGRPLLGDDGIPGTSDDDCTQPDVTWEVSGPTGVELVGKVEPLTGPRTLLTTTGIGGIAVIASFGQGAARQNGGRSFQIVEGTGTASGRLLFTNLDDVEVRGLTILAPSPVAAEALIETLLDFEERLFAFLDALVDLATPQSELDRMQAELRALIMDVVRLVPDRNIANVAAEVSAGATGLPSMFLARVDSVAPDGRVVDTIDMWLTRFGTGYRSVDPLAVIASDTISIDGDAPGLPGLPELPEWTLGIQLIAGVAGGWLRATAPSFAAGTVEVTFGA